MRTAHAPALRVQQPHAVSRITLALVVGLLALVALAALRSGARPETTTSHREEVAVPTLSVSREEPRTTTAFDSDDPEVTNLDADLREALRRAASDAAAEGVRVELNSGWRTPEQQQELLDDAVDTYGSRREAARWVATPETSAHVSGDAVDLGPARAATWLSRHGAAYGLCQTYRNEPWHFELRPEAVTGGCPRAYADPTQDPRMRR